MITGEFTAYCDGAGCKAEALLGNGINYSFMMMEAESRGWKIGNNRVGFATLCPACVKSGNKPEHTAEGRRLQKTAGSGK